MKNNDISAAIAAALEKTGRAPADLARACMVTRQSVNGWLRGGSIKAEHLIAAINFFAPDVPLTHWGIEERVIMEQAAKNIALAQQLLRDHIATPDMHIGQPQECCIHADGRVEARRLALVWLLHNNLDVVRDLFVDEEGGIWRSIGKVGFPVFAKETAGFPQEVVAAARKLAQELADDPHRSNEGSVFLPCSPEDVERIITAAAPEVIKNLCAEALAQQAESAAKIRAMRQARRLAA